MTPDRPDLKVGDVVSPKWGFRSGRWVVTAIDNVVHPDWVKVRCIRTPSSEKFNGWYVGLEGWVPWILEVRP